MSVIRKKPYIETTLKALSVNTVNGILAQLNANTPITTQATFGNIPQGAVNAVVFTLENKKQRTGILVNEGDIHLLICFTTKYQDLDLIELDFTNYTHKHIHQYCDINELRRVINDILYDGVVEITGQSVLGVLDTTNGDLDGELNEDGDLVLSVKDGIIPNVNANPTGNATEPLTKLEVGSTIYSIPDGTIFKYIGTTTTALTDGATTNPITISGESITAVAGNVVFYGDDEFVFDGTTWEQFGSVGFANPMTASQDIIVGGANGTPTRLAKGSNGYLLGVNSSGNLAYSNNLPILTTAPTSANTEGGIKIVVLNSDSGITKYSGYLYIITE